jgi:hypothetical protein
MINVFNLSFLTLGIFLLASCSDLPIEESNIFAEEKELEQHQKAIEQEPIYEYIYGGTQKVKLPKSGNIGGGISYEGWISNDLKKTLKKIWDNLAIKGFSGFDRTQLEAKHPVYFRYASGTVAYNTVLEFPQSKSFFINHLISKIAFYSHYPLPQNFYLKEIKYVSTLLGFKYNDKALILVKSSANEFQAVLTNEFRQDPLGNNNIDYTPSKIDSDIPVTQAQIDEWNQVFIDALKQDPFFGKAPTVPADTSGSVSTLAALKGTTGVNATQFTMNGISGSQVDLGLPMYVQLKGAMDQGKSTDGVTGLVACKLGNSVVGVIQSYANSGAGFSSDSRHMESSIVAAHSFGAAFVEAQFGSVSATDVNYKDWSGVRSQVKLGIDTPFGAPFVQLTHRDFGKSSDTAAYIGFEIANAEFKADTYAFSTTLLTKVGHHSVHGATGSIDWTAALNLNSGVAFNANLTIGSSTESKAAFAISLDR